MPGVAGVISARKLAGGRDEPSPVDRTVLSDMRRQQREGQGVPGAVLYTDGASQGNPGPSGYGTWLQRRGTEVWRAAGPLGENTTSNEAEYMGLVCGLHHVANLDAADLGRASLLVRSDSELLVRQMTGEYAVEDATLQVYHTLANALVARCPVPVHFQHIPREENARADKLAGAAAELKGRALCEHVVGFAPNICEVTRVLIQGIPGVITASNDLASAATAGYPISMIDAAFMAAVMPGEFASIKPCCEKTILNCQHGHQNILGMPSRPIRLQWGSTDCLSEVEEHTTVLVVVGLPVPFHVTTKLGKGGRTIQGNTFCAGSFPRSYWSHPFWNTDWGAMPAIAMGYEPSGETIQIVRMHSKG